VGELRPTKPETPRIRSDLLVRLEREEKLFGHTCPVERLTKGMAPGPPPIGSEEVAAGHVQGRGIHTGPKEW
jgi:hypothetical protein